MSEYYLQLRGIHIGSAILSIALFALRGSLMLADSPRLRSLPMRIVPHVVDTVLLASAVMLTMIVHQYPFVQGWLTMKVVLLVVYIVLGSIAIRRGRTKRIRTAAFFAALATVLFLVSVARAHDPLGIFAGLSAARPFSQGASCYRIRNTGTIISRRRAPAPARRRARPRPSPYACRRDSRARRARWAAAP